MLAHEHSELNGAKYVVFVDLSRRYVDCSPGIADLLGYPRDDMLKKTIDDVSYDVSAVPTLFAQYQRTGSQQGDFILQHKDRRPVPIHYRAFVFDDGCNAAIWEPITDWRLPYMESLLELDSGKQQKCIDRALAEISQHRSADPAAQKVREEAALLLRSMRKQLK